MCVRCLIEFRWHNHLLMDTNEEEYKINSVQTTERNESILLNFRPVLFCAVFLCLGILFGKAYQEGASWLWLIILPFAVCFLVALGRWKSWRRFALKAVLLIFCFAVGLGGYSLQMSNYAKGGRYNGEFYVCGYVETCTLQNEYCRVTLVDIEIDGNQEKGKMVAYLPYTFYDEIDACDELAMTAQVSRNGEETTNSPFDAYSVNENMRYKATAENCLVIGRRIRFFDSVRSRMQEVIQEGMDETCAVVTIGVLTGDDAAIEDGLLKNFRYGGIAHIFAVSGLHVGALYSICLRIIKKTKLKNMPKIMRFVFLATLLLFYGGICGYSASVVRAIVMCLVLYASSLIGIISDLSERIAAAAIVVLSLSPIALFTVGFQLSFAACFGICWLSKPISSLLIKKRERRIDEDLPPLGLLESAKNSILSFLAVTVSAQIATAPIQLMSFGYISGWALLLNCIFVPLISLAFSFLLALVFIACIFPLSFATELLYLPNVIWTVLLLAFEIFDFSTFAVTGIALRGGGVCIYYLMCFFCTDKWNLPKKWRMACVVVCLAAFLIATIPFL